MGQSTVLACYGWLSGASGSKCHTRNQLQDSMIAKTFGSPWSPFGLIFLDSCSNFLRFFRLAGQWVCSRCSIWWWRGRGGNPCNWHRGRGTCFLRFILLGILNWCFFAPSPWLFEFNLHSRQRSAGAGLKNIGWWRLSKKTTAPLHLLQPSLVSATWDLSRLYHHGNLRVQETRPYQGSISHHDPLIMPHKASFSGRAWHRGGCP